MFLKQFLIGGDRNYAYLVGDENSREAVVIDPSYNPEVISDFAKNNDYSIKYIFNTHDHSDHTNGNSVIEKITGLKPLIFGDTESTTGIKVCNNTSFKIGNLDVKVLHTPGHTKDSICILAEDALFTGDTLFVGKVGGTYTESEAKAEFYSLHEKLMVLPNATRVFPGHNYGTATESTIEKEKQTNPFLMQATFEAFMDLKINWAEYKLKHGIT